MQPTPDCERKAERCRNQPPDIPPEDYEVKFWQETLGEVTRIVSVKPHENATDGGRDGSQAVKPSALSQYRGRSSLSFLKILASCRRH